MTIYYWYTNDTIEMSMLYLKYNILSDVHFLIGILAISLICFYHSKYVISVNCYTKYMYYIHMLYHWYIKLNVTNMSLTSYQSFKIRTNYPIYFIFNIPVDIINNAIKIYHQNQIKILTQYNKTNIKT